MNRLRGSQKQTVTLKKFHHLVRSMSSAQARNKRWRLINTRTFIVGLTASVGISSIAFAAAHRPAQAPSHAAEVPPAVTTAESIQGQAIESTIAVGTQVPAPVTNTDSNGSSTTVTLNDEVVPLQNGTVQRTYVNANGNTYSIDVSVSSKTIDASESAATDITIHSHSSSIEQYPARGSPQQ